MRVSLSAAMAEYRGRCLQALKWLWESCMLLSPSALWKSEGFWLRCIGWYCNLRIYWTDHSEERDRLLVWVRGMIPKVNPLTNLTSDWSNGVALCALLDALVPGSCPRHDLLNPENALANAELAIKLLNRHLGIKTSVTAKDMVDCNPGLEKKLMVLLSQLELASSRRMLRRTIEAPYNARAHPTSFEEDGDCVAKGMGLVLAVKGRKACFNIFLKSTSQLNIVIEIRGPCNTICSERLTERSPKRKQPNYSSADQENVKIPFEYEIYQDKVVVGYVPIVTGKHRLSIIWQGQHIMGSPYVVTVDESLENHHEVSPTSSRRLAMQLGNSGSNDQLISHKVSSENAAARKLGTVTRRRVLRHIVRLDGKDVVIEDSNPEEFASAVKALKENTASSRNPLRRQYSLDNSWGFARGIEDSETDQGNILENEDEFLDSKWIQYTDGKEFPNSRARAESAPEMVNIHCVEVQKGETVHSDVSIASRNDWVSFDDEDMKVSTPMTSDLNTENVSAFSSPTTKEVSVMDVFETEKCIDLQMCEPNYVNTKVLPIITKEHAQWQQVVNELKMLNNNEYIIENGLELTLNDPPVLISQINEDTLETEDISDESGFDQTCEDLDDLCDRAVVSDAELIQLETVSHRKAHVVTCLPVEHIELDYSTEVVENLTVQPLETGYVDESVLPRLLITPEDCPQVIITKEPVSNENTAELLEYEIVNNKNAGKSEESDINELNQADKKEVAHDVKENLSDVKDELISWETTEFVVETEKFKPLQVENATEIQTSPPNLQSLTIENATFTTEYMRRYEPDTVQLQEIEETEQVVEQKMKIVHPEDVKPQTLEKAEILQVDEVDILENAEPQSITREEVQLILDDNLPNPNKTMFYNQPPEKCFIADTKTVSATEICSTHPEDQIRLVEVETFSATEFHSIPPEVLHLPKTVTVVEPEYLRLDETVDSPEFHSLHPDELRLAETESVAATELVSIHPGDICLIETETVASHELLNIHAEEYPLSKTKDAPAPGFLSIQHEELHLVETETVGAPEFLSVHEEEGPLLETKTVAAPEFLSIHPEEFRLVETAPNYLSIPSEELNLVESETVTEPEHISILSEELHIATTDAVDEPEFISLPLEKILLHKTVMTPEHVSIPSEELRIATTEAVGEPEFLSLPPEKIRLDKTAITSEFPTIHLEEFPIIHLEAEIETAIAPEFLSLPPEEYLLTEPESEFPKLQLEEIDFYKTREMETAELKTVNEAEPEGNTRSLEISEMELETANFEPPNTQELHPEGNARWLEISEIELETANFEIPNTLELHTADLNTLDGEETFDFGFEELDVLKTTQEKYEPLLTEDYNSNIDVCERDVLTFIPLTDPEPQRLPQHQESMQYQKDSILPQQHLNHEGLFESAHIDLSETSEYKAELIRSSSSPSGKTGTNRYSLQFEPSYSTDGYNSTNEWEFPTGNHEPNFYNEYEQTSDRYSVSTDDTEEGVFPSVETRKKQFEELTTSIDQSTPESTKVHRAAPTRSTSYRESLDRFSSIPSRSQSQGSVLVTSQECDFKEFNQTKDFWESSTFSKSNPDVKNEINDLVSIETEGTVKERMKFWETMSNVPEIRLSPARNPKKKS